MYVALIKSYNRLDSVALSSNSYYNVNENNLAKFISSQLNGSVEYRISCMFVTLGNNDVDKLDPVKATITDVFILLLGIRKDLNQISVTNESLQNKISALES